MIVISISIFNLYFFIQYNVRKKSVKRFVPITRPATATVSRYLIALIRCNAMGRKNSVFFTSHRKFPFVAEHPAAMHHGSGDRMAATLLTLILLLFTII